MPLLDLRPPAVNLHYRAGNSVTLTLTWTPTGTLTGRTFQATLDAAALSLAVVGDTMTITASEAQTAAAAAVGTFTLTETTGGIDQELITGTWSASDDPSATSNTAVTVTESAATIAVTAGISNPGASNEIDSAEVTTNLGPFAGDAFAATLHALVGTTVTVTSQTGPVYLMGHAKMQHSAADTIVGVCIAPTGSTLLTSAIGRAQGGVLTNNFNQSFDVFARLPAATTGDYQMFAYGGVGNITANGETTDPITLVALAV